MHCDASSFNPNMKAIFYFPTTVHSNILKHTFYRRGDHHAQAVSQVKDQDEGRGNGESGEKQG